MNRTTPRPQHPSYLAHRRQVVWQIIVPIVLAFLILIGAIYLVVWGTFNAGGDVARWAAISTIWLVLPVMLAAILMLAVLIALSYLFGRLVNLIPRYTYPAQKYAAQMEAGARKVEKIGHKPLLIFPEFGRLIKAGFNRIREG